MAWIWILPSLLLGTLLLVFGPLFLRRGYAPLPAGLEGNPRAELEGQRDLLLRQVKELDYQETVDGDVRAELESRLAMILTALDHLPASASSAPSAPERGRIVPLDLMAGIVVMTGVTVISGGLYLFMGTPVSPSGEGIAAEPHAEAGMGDIQVMVDRLAQRLRNTPEDTEGWLRLARSRIVLGDTPGALAAYGHLLDRNPDSRDAAAGVGALLVESDDQTLFPLGLEIFKRILAHHPDHPESLWIMGVLAFQADRPDQAVELWQRLLDQTPPDAPLAQQVREAIAQARSGTPPGGQSP
ncbi:MAG: tetratricopeptide repeat protein [Magnetococcales bacterium]|nr:tetratricopeptide repeat protein [Magnetococcales bacterium]